MKTTKRGYALNKNGKPITQNMPDEVFFDRYRGVSFKENGTYYFFKCHRGSKSVYTT